MATVDDMATEAEERDRELCLSRRKPELKSVKQCYNCLEQIDDGCFCDAFCREDYTKRKNFNLRTQ